MLDEAYVEFVDAPGFQDALALPRQYPNVVVLRTFSKIYGLAGLRLGYGLARPEVVEYVDRVRPPFNVSLVAQAAGVAALGDARARGEEPRARPRGAALPRGGARGARRDGGPVAGQLRPRRLPRPAGKDLFEALLREGRRRAAGGAATASRARCGSRSGSTRENERLPRGAREGPRPRDRRAAVHRRDRRPRRRGQVHRLAARRLPARLRAWWTPARSTGRSRSRRLARGIALDDDAALAALLPAARDPLRAVAPGGGQRVLLGEDDVSAEIRTPPMSLGASKVSARPVVRAGLLDLQRRLALRAGEPRRGARGARHRHGGLPRRRREVLPHRLGRGARAAAATPSSARRATRRRYERGARRPAAARQGRLRARGRAAPAGRGRARRRHERRAARGRGRDGSSAEVEARLARGAERTL